MSLSDPSHVSATIGSDQSNSKPFFTSHSITASRTMPTLCVLVIITGPARKPDSKSAGAGTILCAESLSCNQEDQRAETQDGAHCHDSVRTPFLEQLSEGFARPTDHKVGSTFPT